MLLPSLKQSESVFFIEIEKTNLKHVKKGKDLQDGGEIRLGDQLPSHKYIKNTSTCGTAPTEHLLNAGKRPQTSKRQETPHVPG